MTNNNSGDGTFPWGKKGNLGGRSPPFIDKCEAFLLQGRRLWGIFARGNTTSAQHYALETSLSTASPLLLHVSTQHSPTPQLIRYMYHVSVSIVLKYNTDTRIFIEKMINTIHFISAKDWIQYTLLGIDVLRRWIQYYQIPIHVLSVLIFTGAAGGLPWNPNQWPTFHPLHCSQPNCN
jgi:hypothetical protein